MTQRQAELERLIAEQQADAAAEAKGRVSLPRHEAEDSGNAAPTELVGLIEDSKLDGRAKHVLLSRVAGRSFGAIAADKLLGGLTRQGIALIEKRARQRIGFSLSVEEYQAMEREERSRVMQERGRLVHPGELHNQ